VPKKIILAMVFAMGGFAWAQPQPAASPAPTPVPTPNPASPCITSICGTVVQSNPYFFQFQQKLSAYVESAGKNPGEIEYPPNIKAIVSDIIAESEKPTLPYEPILKALGKGPDFQLQGDSKKIYNFMRFMLYVEKLKYMPLASGGKDQLSLDEDATRKNLGDLPEKEKNWIIQASKYFIQGINWTRIEDIQTTPPVLLLKGRYPQMSLDQALNLEMSKGLGNLRQAKGGGAVQQALYFNGTSEDRLKYLATQIESKKITEDEIRELLSWNANFNLFQIVLSKTPANVFDQGDLPSAKEILQKSGGADQILAKMKKSESEGSQKVKDQTDSCKMYYFLNKRLLPNSSDIEQLNREITRSKESVKSEFISRFPAAVRKAMTAAVDGTDFILPPTKGDFEKAFADHLIQRRNAITEERRLTLQISQDDLKSVLVAVLPALEDKYVRSSNDFCDSFKYWPMSDANYTGFGSVILSYSTAAGKPDSKRKTIMHELGHSISKAMKSDQAMHPQFEKIAQCLDGQHVEELPDHTWRLSSEQKAKDPKTLGPYIEEDFADLVAAVSAKRAENNPWCQFIMTDDKRLDYSESSLQAADDDPHSSQIFRLLHFEYLEKCSIPPACEKYLEQVKFQPHFQDCFEKTVVARPASKPSSGAQ